MKLRYATALRSTTVLPPKIYRPNGESLALHPPVFAIISDFTLLALASSPIFIMGPR
ncbi:hypothetical protein QFZ88_000968 [Mesorhizobium sp. YL-MeA3-2017]|jgi:hypothetical protein|nr:hypothetical protein [Mesorhizobium sp. YL-MeA3-2017]